MVDRSVPESRWSRKEGCLPEMGLPLPGSLRRKIDKLMLEQVTERGHCRERDDGHQGDSRSAPEPAIESLDDRTQRTMAIHLLNAVEQAVAALSGSPP